jgi:pyroglutamyl-peptidase
MAGALAGAVRHDGKFGPNDEAPLAWLVTGFGPFPRVPRNPSEILAQRLAQGWNLRHQRVQAHVFKTAYATVECDIKNLAALRPRAVLMLGVAARAKGLRVEQFAINRRATAARDAGGALPGTPVIRAGAAAFRAGRHKGAPLVGRLREAGVSARISRDAGRYLCNFAYWTMLAAVPDAMVCFIHIPLPGGRAKGDIRPSLREMERALRALMRGRI